MGWAERPETTRGGIACVARAWAKEVVAWRDGAAGMAGRRECATMAMSRYGSAAATWRRRAGCVAAVWRRRGSCVRGRHLQGSVRMMTAADSRRLAVGSTTGQPEPSDGTASTLAASLARLSRAGPCFLLPVRCSSLLARQMTSLAVAEAFARSGHEGTSFSTARQPISMNP